MDRAFIVFIVVAIAVTALLMSGCAVVNPDYGEYVYTRSEVDAINAQSACKLMARNLVQIERCKRGN